MSRPLGRLFFYRVRMTDPRRFAWPRRVDDRDSPTMKGRMGGLQPPYSSKAVISMPNPDKPT